MPDPKDTISGLEKKPSNELDLAAEFQAAYVAALQAIPAIVESLDSISASLYFLAVCERRKGIDGPDHWLTLEDLKAFPCEENPDGNSNG